MNYDKLPAIQEAVLSGKPVLQIAVDLSIPVPSIVEVLPTILNRIQEEHQARGPFMDALNYTRLDMAINRVLERLLDPEVDLKLLDRLAKALAALVKAQKEFMPEQKDKNKNQVAEKIYNNNMILVSKPGDPIQPKTNGEAWLLKHASMLLENGDDEFFEQD